MSDGTSSLYRVQRAGQAAAAPSRAAAWVRGHQKQAAAGAAGLVVVLFALHARNSSPSSSAGNDAAAQADAGDGSTGTNTAGLSSPAVGSSADDIENWVQDQLNQQQQQIDAALANAGAPAAPSVPAPVGRGKITYKIVSGDTIGRICTKVYGQDTLRMRNDIRAANPALATFGDNASLSYFVGRTITIPAYHAPPATPAKGKGKGKPKTMPTVPPKATPGKK